MAVDAEKRSLHHVEVVEVSRDGTALNVRAISHEDDQRIRRKTDMVIMPLFCAVYMIQFLDKSALTYSSIMGFIKHSHITQDQYSWLGSIFYLGYLVGEYPMIYLQQRLPLAKFTAFNIVTWGVISIMMTVCGTNYAALLVTRFFLGFFESCITPALMLFTAQWYRQREQGTRTGLWSSFNTLGLVFGGLVSWALVGADKAQTLSMYSWKVLYILLGCMTIVIGLLFGFLIPDSKETAWFLSPADRELAICRMAGNRETSDRRKWQWYQFKEALKDFQCWAIFFNGLLTSIPNGGITNFSAILVKGMGFTTEQTLLLGLLKAWIAVFTFGCLYLGDKLKRRSLVSVFPTMVTVIGAVMVWVLPSSQIAARFAGYQMMLGYAINHVVCASFISSNVAGRTKKTTAFGMYFLPYCIGNLIGPQTFRAKDAPRYEPALIVIVVTNVCAGLLMSALFLYYLRENRRREAVQHVTENDVTLEEVTGDMTDQENPKFRYHY